MNLSTRKLSAYVLVGVAFLAAVIGLAYFGGGIGSSLVAQVTSGLTAQTVGGYETALKYSTGYSSTQGKNNWSYQYRKDADEITLPDGPFVRDTQAEATGYTNMTWTNNRWEAPGTYPLITKRGLHPGIKNEAVIKWTAPKAGEIRITGTAYDNDAGGGNGVKARIFKDNTQLWTSGVIRNGDSVGKTHSINTTVTKGQAIYFIVDNNSSFGDHFYDTTIWDPTIEYKKTGTEPPDDDVNNDLPPGDDDLTPGIVKGNIASVGKDSGGTFVQGWACHQNVDQSITVDIYVGGAKGTAAGVFLLKLPATNLDSSAAVHTACDTPTSIKHNFKYYFSQSAAVLHAGKKLYLYGNSTTGAAGDKILSRSGQVSLPTVSADEPGIVKGNIVSVGKDSGGTFVQGWACHEGVDQSITIDIYAGGAKGTSAGTFVIKTPATDIASPAVVHTACDTPAAIKHNFKYYFTAAALTAHAGKKLYLYGNSTTGAAGDKLLGRSGAVSLPTITTPDPKLGVVKGNIANIGTDSTGTFVQGWACHEGVDKSIALDVYAGGAKGTGTFVITTPATNIASPAAVHTACDTPTAIKHNFKYYFTAAALTAHAGKKIYMYGKSTSTTTPDVLLSRSGVVSLPGVTPPDPDIEGYDIIIVGGQSNAVGAGRGTFTDSVQTDAIDAKIFQLGRRAPSTNKVIPATVKIGTNEYDALQHWALASTTRETMGLSIPFARRYVRDELGANRRVLIVPAAYGGTSIRKWLGEQGTPHLYNDMKARVQAALNLPGENRVVAMLWHQGESDVLQGMTTAVYETKLTSLFNLLRADFPATTPYPIIAGGFTPAWTAGSATKLAYENTIREVLSDDENGGFVSSTGLASNPGDPIHFSSAALVTFGDRYYQKWTDLKEGPGDPGELNIRLLPETDELVWNGLGNCVIPDGPIQMWKNNQGETFAPIATQYNHSLKSNVKGGEFEINPNQVAHRTFTSPQQQQESLYNNSMWLFGFWTSDGRNVYSVAHHEWYHPKHPYVFTGNPSQLCRVTSGRPTSNWVNAVHHLTSNDGGLTFRTTVPVNTTAGASNLGRLILAPELYGSKPEGTVSVTRYGFVHPSNIVKEGDYYYFIVAAREIVKNAAGTSLVPERNGFMIIRTDDISKPSSGSTYEFWDKNKWTEATPANLEIGEPFFFTHKTGDANTEKVPGSIATVDPVFSLKWNPEHSRWIIFGHSFPRELMYITTPSLANPKMERLKLVEDSQYEGPNGPDKNSWFASYPTLIDPTSAGYVFQEVKDDVYLYYVASDGGGRDIRRMKVEIE